MTGSIVRLTFAMVLCSLGLLLASCPNRILEFVAYFETTSMESTNLPILHLNILLSRLLGMTLISFAYQSSLNTLHFHADDSWNDKFRTRVKLCFKTSRISSEVLFLTLVSWVGIIELLLPKTSFIIPMSRLRQIQDRLCLYTFSNTCVDELGIGIISLRQLGCGRMGIILIACGVIYVYNRFFFNILHDTKLLLLTNRLSTSWMSCLSQRMFITWIDKTQLRRIIRLLHAQKCTVYPACCVSFIRWPLSLSIPHYASSALGAIGRGDYTSAKRSIISLLLFGSIDACLEYWFVVLFGLTNLRIVQGLRLEAFSKILKQEMAYFDGIKCGDLVSRINADPLTTGSDLTWFLRSLYVAGFLLLYVFQEALRYTLICI